MQILSPDHPDEKKLAPQCRVSSGKISPCGPPSTLPSGFRKVACAGHDHTILHDTRLRTTQESGSELRPVPVARHICAERVSDRTFHVASTGESVSHCERLAQTVLLREILHKVNSLSSVHVREVMPFTHLFTGEIEGKLGVGADFHEVIAEFTAAHTDLLQIISSQLTALIATRTATASAYLEPGKEEALPDTDTSNCFSSGDPWQGCEDLAVEDFIEWLVNVFIHSSRWQHIDTHEHCTSRRFLEALKLWRDGGCAMAETPSARTSTGASSSLSAASADSMCVSPYAASHISLRSILGRREASVALNFSLPGSPNGAATASREDDTTGELCVSPWHCTPTSLADCTTHLSPQSIPWLTTINSGPLCLGQDSVQESPCWISPHSDSAPHVGENFRLVTLSRRGELGANVAPVLERSSVSSGASPMQASAVLEGTRERFLAACVSARER